MVESLGARLVRAGLVTRELLAAANAQSEHRGTGLAEALVACGLAEDALAGFMLADGHGPLLEAKVLASADPNVAGRVGRGMADAFLALPVRTTADGVVVAMADPSDAHAIREIGFRLASPVVAKVARVGELRAAIEGALPVRSNGTFDATDTAEIPLVREKPRASSPGTVPAARPAEDLAAARARIARARGPQKVVRPATPVPFTLPSRSIEDERWDDPPRAAAPVTPRRAEPSRAAIPAVPGGSRGRYGPKAPAPGTSAPPGDAGIFLAGLRGAVSRDEALRVACEAALTVGGTAVFLGVRKGVFVGWEGLGPGLSRDALRNLWIPVTSASVMKRVLESGTPHDGPYGATPADQLFRAATGCRSARLAAHPVFVSGKALGVLCVDGPSYGAAGQERLAVVAHALGEALKRLILARKG